MTSPKRYVEAALKLKRRGVPLRAIVQALIADGATVLDLVRVVKEIENTDVGTAQRLINETGLLPEPLGLVVVVPEDDPWNDLLFDDGERKHDSV